MQTFISASLKRIRERAPQFCKRMLRPQPALRKPPACGTHPPQKRNHPATSRSSRPGFLEPCPNLSPGLHQTTWNRRTFLEPYTGTHQEWLAHIHSKQDVHGVLQFLTCALFKRTGAFCRIMAAFRQAMWPRRTTAPNNKALVTWGSGCANIVSILRVAVEGAQTGTLSSPKSSTNGKVTKRFGVPIVPHGRFSNGASQNIAGSDPK